MREMTKIKQWATGIEDVLENLQAQLDELKLLHRELAKAVQALRKARS